MELAIDTRSQILKYALTLEGMTSSFLSYLLGIKDYSKSLTLGNKGSSLAFKTKIDLLIDIGALEEKSKSKFQTFMEIRNQFMHNLEASTYEKCFSHMPPGKGKYILEQYPQNKKSDRENQLKNASLELSMDVVDLTSQLIKNVETKIRREVEAEMINHSNEAFIQSIFQVKENFKSLAEDYKGKKDMEFEYRLMEGPMKSTIDTILVLWTRKFNELIHTDSKTNNLDSTPLTSAT